MHPHPSISRRRFLQASAAASACGGLGLPAAAQSAAAQSSAASDPYRGLKMGVASYSFRKFTLDQSISMTNELGLKYICLKEMHLPLKSTTAECQAAAAKVKDAGLTLMGCGVVTFKKGDDARNVFRYAKDAGMPTIVASPDPDLLDSLEALVREFDIRLAIHNHGPGDKWYPSPMDAMKAVKDRDQRMGLCIDVGHTVRIGEDPVPTIRRTAERLYDFHIKDVNEGTAKGKPVVLGTGVIDLPGVLKALLDVGFSGHLGLEYEIDADDPMPGMQKSLTYVREALTKV